MQGYLKIMENRLRVQGYFPAKDFGNHDFFHITHFHELCEGPITEEERLTWDYLVVINYKSHNSPANSRTHVCLSSKPHFYSHHPVSTPWLPPKC